MYVRLYVRAWCVAVFVHKRRETFVYKCDCLTWIIMYGVLVYITDTLYHRDLTIMSNIISLGTQEILTNCKLTAIIAYNIAPTTSCNNCIHDIIHEYCYSKHILEM